MCKLSLGQRDTFNRHRLTRTVAESGRDVLDRSHHIHSRNYLPEYGVLGIEETIVGHIDEELAAVGIRARIGHRDRTRLVAIVRMDLIGKLVARAAGPPAVAQRIVFGKGVAALDHEILDHAVEFDVVVEVLARELHEIRDGIRRVGLK